MRITTYIKSITLAVVSVFMLSGCSSGTTATGLGLDVGGFWKGTLMGNGRVVANFSMSLAQAQAGDDPFGPSALTGTFNSDSTCVGSGPMSGTTGGNSIVLQSGTFNGALEMTGTTNNNSMSGSWVFSGSIEEGESSSSCNSGGTFSARR